MSQRSRKSRKPRRNDRLGVDAAAVRLARISPERVGAPARDMTIGEMRDAFGQGLPTIIDAVKEFLGLEPDEIACVNSAFHIIYHPLICMALAAEGLFSNYEIRLTNFDYQHASAPAYITVPISCTETMRCLSEGTLFLSTPGGIKFVVRLSVDPYQGAVSLNVHVPAAMAEIADRFFAGIRRFIAENNIFQGQKITPDGGFVNVADYTWDDLILPEEKKQAIRRNIVDIIVKQRIYERNGVAMKRGVMFYGPPGTGKTLTGKVLANQMKGVTFIWVTPNHIKGSASVAAIYSLARELAPTIVFIEDIDLIARDRSIDAENPVLCELMNQLDGIQENRGVITVVTTNHDAVIETALQNRPGRFDRRIEFGLPDVSTREIMLAAMLDGRILEREGEPVDLRSVAEMSDGLSPSHLKEIVNTAVMNAIDAESLNAVDLAIIKQSHLVDAVTEILENCPEPPAPGAGDDADMVTRNYEGNGGVDCPAIAAR